MQLWHHFHSSPWDREWNKLQVHCELGSLASPGSHKSGHCLQTFDTSLHGFWFLKSDISFLKSNLLFLILEICFLISITFQKPEIIIQREKKSYIRFHKFILNVSLQKLYFTNQISETLKLHSFLYMKTSLLEMHIAFGNEHLKKNYHSANKKKQKVFFCF